jgi:hypothetical protein
MVHMIPQTSSTMKWRCKGRLNAGPIHHRRGAVASFQLAAALVNKY